MRAVDREFRPEQLSSNRPEVQVTATKSWGPTLTKDGKRGDNQIAAPTETRNTTGTERISLKRVRMEGWRQMAWLNGKDSWKKRSESVP